jgi:hypothetical protein
VYIVMNESDGASAFDCELPGPGVSDYSGLTRALAAGKFSEADDRDTFAAGLPDPSAPYGSVRLIDWNSMPTCAGDIIMPPSGQGRQEEYFGTALAALDLDGDGVHDLIVGSPNKKDRADTNSRVYVYLSAGFPRALTYTPSYIVESDMLHFGSSVAAMDLTGDGVPELVVGDPQASFGGNRGRAYVFEVAWTYDANPTYLAAEDGVILGDTAEPATMLGSDLKAASSAFGTQLAGLSWWPDPADPDHSRRELVVGASDSIFVFYLTGLPGDDDRDTPNHDPRQ